MTDHHFTTSSDALAAFEAQGACPAGTEGFWKVYGAQVRHIRAGDLIATKSSEEEEVQWILILDTFEAKAAPLRRGFISDPDSGTDAEGAFTLGALSPVVVLRWGTCATLA
jgi:hypothetical protein